MGAASNESAPRRQGSLCGGLCTPAVIAYYCSRCAFRPRSIYPTALPGPGPALLLRQHYTSSGPHRSRPPVLSQPSPAIASSPTDTHRIDTQRALAVGPGLALGMAFPVKGGRGGGGGLTGRAVRRALPPVRRNGILSLDIVQSMRARTAMLQWQFPPHTPGAWPLHSGYPRRGAATRTLYRHGGRRCQSKQLASSGLPLDLDEILLQPFYRLMALKISMLLRYSVFIILFPGKFYALSNWNRNGGGSCVF